MNTTTPVQGMTYATANSNAPGGIGYTEAPVPYSSTTQKNWACEGSLTFDTVAGKLYKFHFSATCGYPGVPYNAGAALGSVTVTGTGAGQLD